MQRRLRDNTNDAILFRQSIMETTQIQPSGDVSCILRRKIYLESDNEHGSRMARELARFRRRHGLPNPVIESPVAPWSGDGVIRSTQSGKQHRLELHYGLVHPDPSGGQFMSTSMVCTAKQPIWAGSMGSIHVRRGSNPFVYHRGLSTPDFCGKPVTASLETQSHLVVKTTIMKDCFGV